MNLIASPPDSFIPVEGDTQLSDIISIKGVGVSYHGSNALAATSLKIRQGNITALIGPSGCGKTSLLLCLNRLIDLVPGANCTGEAIVEGDNILCPKADVQSIRKKIGMVFQRPNPFPFSIRRNFDLVFGSSGPSDRELRERRMQDCLRAVGLWDEVGNRLDQPATDLSGGQQQRLCIARALATNPEILLLDEPCSALDPISTMTIENLMLSLKESVTLVVVTHNIAQAKRLADDCALFWSEQGTGYLLEYDTMQNLIENPAHQVTSDYLTGKLA